MPVRMIFDSGQPYTGRAFTDCMQGARTHAIPVVRAQRGMRWNSGDGVTLNILAPSPPMLVCSWHASRSVSGNRLMQHLQDHALTAVFLSFSYG
jgi:hypothetical protein